MFYGRRRPYLCLVLCTLLVWLTCYQAFAKPVKSNEKVADVGRDALKDALGRVPGYEGVGNKIAWDKAVAGVVKDDKGHFGMTLIPLDYPGEPKVGAKALTMGFIALTDLEKEQTRKPAVLAISMDQPKEDKFRMHLKDLNTGKQVPDDEIAYNSMITWQEELNERQQADPSNHNAAMWSVDDNDSVAGLTIKTTSERTWVVVIIFLFSFAMGYFAGTAYFTWGSFHWF